jgi:hypothetical protein
LTAKVFERIRQAQPKQLLIIADGPRNDTESLLCNQARTITEVIDWDCEVFRNYSDVNLGCRKRVSSGLDWAFEQVEEAIILEDDCLPDPSFFRYCQELLEYYREDERIWCISGNNFQDGQRRGDGSYYFSNYNHCWGWASWQRAWEKYDYDLASWEKFRDGKYLSSILDSELEVKYWHDIFEQLYVNGMPNTWDYAWTFTCWQNSGLTVLPNVNLVSNIGFRKDGTHIMGESQLANLITQDIGKIFHPSFLIRDRTADEYTFDYVFGGKKIRESNSTMGTLKSKASQLKKNLKNIIAKLIYGSDKNKR